MIDMIVKSLKCYSYYFRIPCHMTCRSHVVWSLYLNVLLHLLWHLASDIHTWHLISDTWYLTCYHLTPDTWHLISDSDTWHVITWHLIPDTWYLIPNIRHLTIDIIDTQKRWTPAFIFSRSEQRLTYWHLQKISQRQADDQRQYRIYHCSSYLLFHAGTQVLMEIIYCTEA